jgi:multidrug efflux system membrane fusion protein
MNPRRANWWLACSVLVLLCGVAPAAEAPEVPVVRPIADTVTDYESFTGRTQAHTQVDLRARVSGYLSKTSFQEGGEVKQGDVLFEIDPRPYQADLDRAEAELRLAEAKLKLADAHLDRLKTTAQRTPGAVGRDDLDQAAAEQTVAAARVKAAQATREAARLNLDFTRVTAPIAGHIGRRLVDPGNLVKADDTLLATIVSRDPLFVYFDIDERTLLHMRRLMKDRGRTEKTPVFIGLADEDGYPHRAEVDFSDNKVNPQTGTLSVRAVLPNKDRLLMPGLFVRLRLPLGEPYKALLVPQEAVLTDGGIKYVYAVTETGKIEFRRVTLGQEVGDRRVVREGLKQDDRVVVGRQQRLRPGMTVRPVEGNGPRDTPPRDDAPPRAKPEADARPAAARVGPVFLVETRYPGANARLVADTVAAPIEEQVNGMEGLLYLRSRCDNNGKYTLVAGFARGSNPQFSHVLLQNRVNVAEPVLPEAVKRLGVTTREQAPGVPMVVALLSPDGTFDSIYLSNYARIHIKDELTRLEGVAGATLAGAGDYSLRIWLDTARLAARDLTVAEVLRALQEQNLPVDKGQAGKKKEGDPITLDGRSRGVDPEALADIVLKAKEGGPIIRLKDVARIELGATREPGRVALDGKPAVILALHTRANVSLRKLRAAVRDKVAELRSRLPRGADLTIPFDLTPQAEGRVAAHLLVDLDLPPAASPERRDKMLQHAEALLRRVRGVEHTLSLSENPFDVFAGGPCILAALTPDREKKPGEIVQAIRSRLDEIKEMSVRVRDLSAPGSLPACAYPVDLAVHGPEWEHVRSFAKKLAERLEGSKDFRDVWLDRGSLPQSMLEVEIDRDKCRAMRISPSDVFDTLQIYLGSYYVNDFNRFGRTWQITVQAVPRKDQVKDLQSLKVRNTKGDMVPLATIMTLREMDGPLALDRLDSKPMMEITANLAPDVSPEQVRTLCRKLADEVRRELRLPASYRLSWLK